MKATWEPSKYLEIITNNFYLCSIKENDISEKQVLWLRIKKLIVG